jgi:putative SOS response-associated peptidase YedK
MCGRITRTSPREAIAKEFGVTRFAEVDWHPRYNVAPSQIVETIISVGGEKRLGPMRWGFVSPTTREPKLAPINARAETLSTSPISARLPTPSLPRCGPTASTSGERTTSQEDAVLRAAQVG